MAAEWASRLGVLVVVLAVTTTGLIKWISFDNNSSTTINYISKDFFHESADWDAENRRVLLSIFSGGGVVEVRVNGSEAGAVLKAESVVVPEEEGGPSWVGVRVDAPRHRVLVVLSTLQRDFSALAAYDSRSWELLFRRVLAGPEAPSYANDVAVDDEGNAYVTDSASSRIWKVSPDGSQSFVLVHSPALKAVGPLPFEPATINGIVYHPEGYLLVGHTAGGALFKVSLDGIFVQRVNISGSIYMADGMALLTPDKLVIASALGTKLVATSDDWKTGEVTHRYSGPLHRLGTAVFVKDGKPFTSFGLGVGIREFSSTIREAVF